MNGCRGAHDHQPLGSYWHLLGGAGIWSFLSYIYLYMYHKIHIGAEHFLTHLPAELQHIERRNFVGTQLEKAAEDANLEAFPWGELLWLVNLPPRKALEKPRGKKKALKAGYF